MRLIVAAVGKPRNAALAAAIGDYEKRAARYWPLDVHEVKEERAGGIDHEQVRDREGARLLERASGRIVACNPGGRSGSITPIWRINSGTPIFPMNFQPGFLRNSSKQARFLGIREIIPVTRITPSVCIYTFRLSRMMEAENLRTSWRFRIRSTLRPTWGYR